MTVSYTITNLQFQNENYDSGWFGPFPIWNLVKTGYLRAIGAAIPFGESFPRFCSLTPPTAFGSSSMARDDQQTDTEHGSARKIPQWPDCCGTKRKRAQEKFSSGPAAQSFRPDVH